MKAIFDHIERVKGRPHHVRKRVTFTYAGALTALIAVVWLGTSLSTGTFALTDTSFTDGTGGATTVTGSGDAASAGLAGAAATPAAMPNTAARIEIIDAATSTSQKPEPTTIPF